MAQKEAKPNLEIVQQGDPALIDIGDDELNHPDEISTNCCDCFSTALSFVGYLLITFDILYIIFLCSLLYQPWFKYLREYLSGYTSQPQRELYAENCDLTLSNLKGNVDIFVLSHFATNLVIALALRNRLFCWVNSILWEIIEFSYAYFAVFNYQYARECWWDSLIFDIFGFNALGIEVGLLILKYGLRDHYPLFPEWKRPFIALFGKCKWSMKNVEIIIDLLLLFAMIQLPSFAFWEYTFWLTASHWLSGIRYAMVGFSAIPGFAGLYKWMFMEEEDTNCCSKKSLMHNHWPWLIIIWTIVMLELVLTVRHYLDE